MTFYVVKTTKEGKAIVIIIVRKFVKLLSILIS